MDAQLEEYLRRRRGQVALDETDVESSDPGDMDRNLSPEPLALRERPRFDNLIAGLDAPRLQAEADVALERGAADEVADMAGRRLGRDGTPLPAGDVVALKPLPAGRGVPAPTDEDGSAGGYLEALRKAQRRDDLNAAFSRLGSAGEQFGEVASRGAYKANPLPPMPSEVSKEEKRRAAVAEYLKQKRDGALADADIRLKNAHADALGRVKPPPPAKPVLTQEQFDRLTESQIAANNRRGQLKPPKPKDAGPKLNPAAEKLRNEFNRLPEVKLYNEIEGHYKTMESAVQSPSAAGDIALVYNFMSLIDPGSHVLDGEQAQAQNAAGVPDRVRNQYNKLLTGERLTDDQRRDFLAQGRMSLTTHANQLNAAAERYTAIAKKSGADPEDVVVRPKNEGKSAMSGQPKLASGAPAGMVKMSDGTQTLFVHENDVPKAEKKNFKVVP